MGVLISDQQLQNLLRTERACVILNSRQSKRPCGSDEWVMATRKAIEVQCSRNCLFLTSIGMISWELTVHLVNLCQGRQIIVVPADLAEYGYATLDHILRGFRLDEMRTYVHVLDRDRNIPAVEWPKFRDEFVIRHARKLVPVALRPSGRLQSLLEKTVAEIDSSFCIRYRKPVDTIRYDWSRMKLNPGLRDNWNYLTHWTRSTFFPPTTEDRFVYYNAILNSTDYPGSAFHVLQRILTAGRIHASGRFIRGGYRVVSLTELAPTAAIKLMRWRRRYAYYSFEPYGIAIKSAYALSIGCRPVAYGKRHEFELMPESDRPFYQNIGSPVAEWQPEAEWRHCGDLEIGSTPAEMLRVITHRESEIDELRKLCDREIVALTVGN